MRRLLVRLPASPLPGNNLGQVVHKRVPLSPSSISGYGPNRLEGNGSIWKLWLFYISELHSLLAQGLGNEDKHCSHRSRSCKRALLTISDLPFLPYLYSDAVVEDNVIRWADSWAVSTAYHGQSESVLLGLPSSQRRSRLACSTHPRATCRLRGQRKQRNEQKVCLWSSLFVYFKNGNGHSDNH